MLEWFLKHCEIIIAIAVAVFGGFFGFMLWVFSKLSDHGERLKALETMAKAAAESPAATTHQLQQKMAKLEAELNSICHDKTMTSKFNKMQASLSQLRQGIEHIKDQLGNFLTRQSPTPPAQGSALPPYPIHEISHPTGPNGKKRPHRRKKSDKQDNPQT